MEEGVVVEASPTALLVWLKGAARALSAPLQPLQQPSSQHGARQLQVGDFVRVTLKPGGRGEIASLAAVPTKGTVTYYDKILKIRSRVIFPPPTLQSKIGLKLYSAVLGPIAVAESWRRLFEHASAQPLTVYEAVARWCPSQREFVLAAQQQLQPLAPEDHRNPTYLTLLKESPWAELVRTPKPAELLMADIIPQFASDSDEEEEQRRDVASSSDFCKTGILMKRSALAYDKWDVFLLDRDQLKNQWTSISERTLSRRSQPPHQGATVEIDLSLEVCFKIQDWCVVRPEESAMASVRNGEVYLDVAVRAEKVVKINGRNVTRLYNKRMLEVYDYNNVLGQLRMGEVARVVVRRAEILPEGRQSDPQMTRRTEWIVHEYGKGKLEMPQTKAEMKRRRDLEEALKEFRFVEFAGDRDWSANDILDRFKKAVRNAKRHEEARLREEMAARVEEERRQREEQEASLSSLPALVIRTEDGSCLKVWVASLGCSLEQPWEGLPEDTAEGDWLRLELDGPCGAIRRASPRDPLLPSCREGSEGLKVWDWFVVLPDARLRKAYSHHLGFLDVTDEFEMPEDDGTARNLYATVEGERLVVPRQGDPSRAGDEERRARLGEALRKEAEAAPQLRLFQQEFKLRSSGGNGGGARQLTDWIPILITGSHDRLFFFSSRVGDGIILPSAHQGGTLGPLRVGRLLEARVEKCPPSPHYHRVRYSAVQLSVPGGSGGAPEGTRIEVVRGGAGGEEVQVTTIVRVEAARQDHFLLSSVLIGVVFICKTDLLSLGRPLAVGERLIVLARRLKSELPSHWRAFKYEHVDVARPSLQPVQQLQQGEESGRPVQQGGRFADRGEPVRGGSGGEPTFAPFPDKPDQEEGTGGKWKEERTERSDDLPKFGDDLRKESPRTTNGARGGETEHRPLFSWKAAVEPVEDVKARPKGGAAVRIEERKRAAETAPCRTVISVMRELMQNLQICAAIRNFDEDLDSDYYERIMTILSKKE